MKAKRKSRKEINIDFIPYSNYLRLFFQNKNSRIRVREVRRINKSGLFVNGCTKNLKLQNAFRFLYILN